MRHDFTPYPAPYHHGTPVLGWLLFAALLVLIALLVYALARGLRPAGVAGAPPPPPAAADALSVLRLRYARGEISRDEFLQAESDLSGARPPAAA
jgi:putative membrane protein